jgi:hypothetical protein
MKNTNEKMKFRKNGSVFVIYRTSVRYNFIYFQTQ